MNLDDYNKMIEKDSKVEQPGQSLKDSISEQLKPKEQPKEEVVEEVTEQPKEEQPKEEVTETPSKFEIEGLGEVTPEEILEWQKGYLRQSDYTKKTQEVASKRKEMEEAVALYEYLRENPHVAKRMADGEATQSDIEMYRKVDPNTKRVVELEQQLFNMSTNMEISRLKNVYSDFDEVKVLNKVAETGLSLEDAYKLVRDVSPKPTNNVDLDTLKAKMREEILNEINDKKVATTTVIDSRNSKPPSTNQGPTFTKGERKLMEAFRMNESEWAKWR